MFFGRYSEVRGPPTTVVDHFLHVPTRTAQQGERSSSIFRTHTDVWQERSPILDVSWFFNSLIAFIVGQKCDTHNLIIEASVYCVWNAPKRLALPSAAY